MFMVYFQIFTKRRVIISDSDSELENILKINFFE